MLAAAKLELKPSVRLLIDFNQLFVNVAPELCSGFCGRPPNDGAVFDITMLWTQYTRANFFWASRTHKSYLTHP